MRFAASEVTGPVKADAAGVERSESLQRGMPAELEARQMLSGAVRWTCNVKVCMDAARVSAPRTFLYLSTEVLSCLLVRVSSRDRLSTLFAQSSICDGG